MAAIVVFVATAALPVHRCEGPSPRRVVHVATNQGGRWVVVNATPAPEAKIPAEQIARDLARGFEDRGLVGGVWAVRTWYPFLLAPLWLVGLLACGRAGERGRRRLGAAFLALSAAVALFEAFYIAADYRGVLRGTPWQRLELVLAWFAVLAVLFWRPGRFRVEDVEGTIAAQTLLGMLHACTFPAENAIRWLSAGHEPDAVLRAIFASYLPDFWVAVAALGLAALPAYLPRRFPLRSRARDAVPAPAEAVP